MFSPFPPLLLCALGLPLTAHAAPAGILARADSAYFAGDPAEALALLETVPGELTQRDARWRAIRSHFALGLLADSGGDRNLAADRGIALADALLSQPSATPDEIYWSAASLGLRALRAGPRTAGELARSARTEAWRLRAADSIHGGAHNLLGRIQLEFLSLPWHERFLARQVLGGEFTSEASWESAEAHLHRAAILWPHMVAFQLDLARLLERRGRPVEAMQAAERALDTPVLHPADPVLHQRARELLDRLRDPTAGREHPTYLDSSWPPLGGTL